MAQKSSEVHFMAEWVLDLLFLEMCKGSPTQACISNSISKGKMMANNNDKLECPDSTLIIMLKMKIIMTALQ